MHVISLQPEVVTIAQLFNTARNGTLEDALIAQGGFTTGTEAFLAIGKQCLRTVGSPVQMRDVNGQVVNCDERIVADPVLDEMNLEWVRLNRAHGVTRRAVVGALIMRAGLLCRILDRSFHHLEGRESGGDLLLRQPLIKARFVQSYSLAEHIRVEGGQYLDESMAIGLNDLHDELSVETTKAAKLMGGHGFLIGELNTLEIISLTLSTICAKFAPITLPKLELAPKSLEPKGSLLCT